MLTILAGATSERTSLPWIMPGQAPVGGVQHGAADLVDEVVVCRRLADDAQVPLAFQRTRVGIRVELGRGLGRLGGIRGGSGLDGRHRAPPVSAVCSAGVCR